jgi:hypothetical protein
MPLTDDLGSAVISLLPQNIRQELNAPKFENGEMSFEAWLSWLSEDQPYESDGANSRRRGNFQELQAQISNVIRERQREVFAKELPKWLFTFLDIANFSKSTIISLNYDTIIESAFSLGDFKDQSGDRVFSSDLIKFFSPFTGIRFDGGTPPVRNIESLELIKLHGSIDWYRNPNDETGQSLERVEESLNRLEYDDYHERLNRQGKIEFIIPPTNKKNSYFDIPSIKQMWRQAYKALESANHVVFMGYSIPINDLSMASMISKLVRLKEIKFTVVDSDSLSVVQHLKVMGTLESNITRFDGMGCISEFVRDLDERSQNWAAKQLESMIQKRQKAPIAVGWNTERVAAIVGVKYDVYTKTLFLETDKLGRNWDLHRPTSLVEEIQGNRYLDSSSLLSIIPFGLSINSIQADIPESGRWNIGGFIKNMDFVGANQLALNQDDWIFLRPTSEVTKA